jgi:ADP-heptose:LPS heptosyltransferase
VTRRVLVVRLDSAGDMLLAGPAVRALASGGDEVVVLAGPLGEEPARLLPGVAQVLTWTCPWIVADPPPLDPTSWHGVVDDVRSLAVDEAVVLTSFHQSALPTALLLRLAGVRRVTAISEDYPGSLLDVRVAPPGDVPEPERALTVVRAAGFDLPPGDDGRLAVRPDALDAAAGDDLGRYVVVHPGVSAPARAWPASRWVEAVTALVASGRRVVVTGGPGERELCARVAAAGATDLSGGTSLAALGAVLRDADAVVVANTGPAHLAAAVGTPVVSLFAPVVPAARWAPYGVPHVLLGDQGAPCAGTRARTCPVPGHPCLTDVTAAHVVAAVDRLAVPVEPVAATAPRGGTA